MLVDLDPYTMPRIDQLFHKIGQGNKYFSTLDLHSGYWQIEIDDRDRYKTAFTWKNKCYQYTRLAFGLTSAGQIFSRCVADVLASVSAWSNISSYIDDNLVHAKRYGEYILALEQLFAALHKFGLKPNPEKCTFLATECAVTDLRQTPNTSAPSGKWNPQLRRRRYKDSSAVRYGSGNSWRLVYTNR